MLNMNYCSHCGSHSLTYITGYEHYSENDNIIYDNGWLCDSCECFYHENGEYFEFFGSYEDTKSTNYSQIMHK